MWRERSGASWRYLSPVLFVELKRTGSSKRYGFTPQDYFLSRAAFSSLVSLLFQTFLLRPSSLGKGLVLPTLTSPPLFRNSCISASSVVFLGTCFMDSCLPLWMRICHATFRRPRRQRPEPQNDGCNHGLIFTLQTHNALPHWFFGRAYQLASEAPERPRQHALDSYMPRLPT